MALANTSQGLQSIHGDDRSTGLWNCTGGAHASWRHRNAGHRVQSLVRDGPACHAAAAPGATVTEARLSRAARCPAEPCAAATEARTPGALAPQGKTLPQEKAAPHRAGEERARPSAASCTRRAPPALSPLRKSRILHPESALHPQQPENSPHTAAKAEHSQKSNNSGGLQMLR